MRRLTAVVFLTAIGSLACANRGMHAPDDGGAGTGGSVATAGRGGHGGTGGTGGTGGQVTGTGGCQLPAGAAMSGGACGAMFSFETDLQGAKINSGSTAFTGLTSSSVFTFCGSGALAIGALFSGTSGPTTKGEVLINLPGAPLDLTGKTITIHVAADPGCSTDLNLAVVLNTSAGQISFNPAFPIRPVNNSWKTGTATVPAVPGSTSALALSLQAFSSTNYAGTIYIDEIDVR